MVELRSGQRAMIHRPGAALVGLPLVMLTSCGGGIPSGAQQLHVAVADSEIRLAPDVVHAGDIYLVLDLPGSSITLVQQQRTADQTPGPLSDDDLARLAHGGDAQGFSIEIVSDPGCADDRGRMGPPCGNVYGPVVLGAGRYAFLIGAIEHGPPRSMAVLEVLP
jgi:hypothetical protein